MNMHWIDWSIVFGTALFFIASVFSTKKYARSTADFLAANRCAGRYLLTLAEGIAGLAAIWIVAQWQMNYKVGFASGWWQNLAMPVMMIAGLLGWVIYRYRETRALTLAQFFEIRYGRSFRIFAGITCWVSGMVNFGIFPAVGANFFISYCNLPEYYQLAGLALPTYQSLIVVLVGISLYFTFSGGQITVLVTDFLQSVFCNVVLMLTVVLLLVKFPLSDVFEGLLIAEKGNSMVNPFDSGESDFSPWYFVIFIVGTIFNRLAWQGSQAYNCSAKSPHEAKMAGVLAGFRGWAFMYAITLVPLVAYMIMHHPDYAAQAGQVNQMLGAIGNEQIRDQMLVPMTMTLYMPVGMFGAFAAVMFAAFISTHDTYLHSWGSILVQDIVMPLRKKAFTNEQHIRALRLSTVFVAVFICLFSSFFRQTQHIFMYWALTGAIWLGGAGAFIIGGLYTRWGNTAGAYAALVGGSTIASAGLLCHQMWEGWHGREFPLDGQEIYFFAMLASSILYVVFSLAFRRPDFDLDKMLHRGKYRIASEHAADGAAASTRARSRFELKKIFGITEDFTRGDKVIYGITIFKSLLVFVLFIVMTLWACLRGLSDKQWSNYHYYMLWIMMSLSFIIAAWLLIGGVRDLIALFKDLRTAKRDLADDGRVAHGHNLADETE
ncbi:MAG: sodium:solute symporter [Verrucomicrobiota bacterium]